METNQEALQRPTQNRFRTTTGTRVLDRAVHKTNIWLKDISDEMLWDNRERSFSCLRATLHALRDVLPLQESAHFAAQLPMILRGVYFEGWNPAKRPIRLRETAEFFYLVWQHLGGKRARYSKANVWEITHTCIAVINQHIAHGEMEDIRSVLPRALRNLIPGESVPLSNLH